MATLLSPFLSSPDLHQRRTRNPLRHLLLDKERRRRSNRASFMSATDPHALKSTKLVTFLGKGGSGKTTSAILAAQYYAKLGLQTCLVIHSQDPTAESLMGCKIGTTPVIRSEKLSVVRLETTKMLLEPLDRMKKADARLNLTQGVLAGVVGEELGVLPGMDSILSLLALEKLIGFLGRTIGKINKSGNKFDMVVYDGISAEETIRMIGSADRARWYLKYFRSIAEKSDVGRLTAPSFLKLADESISFNGGSRVDGRTSSEIWDEADQKLEKASASFADPSKFGCYLVMDSNNSVSVDAALRYWGCAIQAGAQVSGALSFAPKSSTVPVEILKKKIFPLDFAIMPYFSTDSSVSWDSAVEVLSDNARRLLCSSNHSLGSSVTFDRSKKVVTLFMPGFDKSEIKLYQYRGGSELLVEAGDQRRVIRLPVGIQGKVGGAKFIDRSLIVTLR